MSNKYSEGICDDGAAILKDGVMMPIEEVISELNQLAAAREIVRRQREVLRSVSGCNHRPCHNCVAMVNEALRLTEEST